MRAAGPTYSIIRLCENLIQRNIDSRVVTLKWAHMDDPPAFREAFDLGLGPRRLGRSPSMKKWLRKLAVEEKICLLHTHSLWMMPNIYPAKLARQFGIPFVVSPRGTLSDVALRQKKLVKQVFWSLVQSSALKSCSCFHATSITEASQIRKKGFNQPIAVIPNGVDIPISNTVRPITSNRTLLFMAGSTQ